MVNTRSGARDQPQPPPGMEQLFAGQIEFLRNLTAQVASLQAQVNQQPPQAGQFRYAYKLGEGRFGSVLTLFCSSWRPVLLQQPPASQQCFSFTSLQQPPANSVFLSQHSSTANRADAAAYPASKGDPTEGAKLLVF